MIIVESPYHPVVAEIRIFDTLTGSSSSTWFNRPPPPGGPCRKDKPPDSRYLWRLYRHGFFDQKGIDDLCVVL